MNVLQGLQVLASPTCRAVRANRMLYFAALAGCSAPSCYGLPSGPCRSAESYALQGKQRQSGLQYDRLQALDSPALRAGNWGQLCVTCKVRECDDSALLHAWLCIVQLLLAARFPLSAALLLLVCLSQRGLAADLDAQASPSGLYMHMTFALSLFINFIPCIWCYILCTNTGPTGGMSSAWK